MVAQILILSCASLLTRSTGYEGGWMDYPAQLIGMLLMLLAAILAIVGLCQLRDSITPFPRPREEASLKTGGIYHYVRHPVYVAIILSSFGWALWWMSAPGALYAVVVAFFLDRKAAREEKWLKQRYPEYSAYARDVRRFIPRVY